MRLNLSKTQLVLCEFHRRLLRTIKWTGNGTLTIVFSFLSPDRACSFRCYIFISRALFVPLFKARWSALYFRFRPTLRFSFFRPPTARSMSGEVIFVSSLPGKSLGHNLKYVVVVRNPSAFIVFVYLRVRSNIADVDETHILILASEWFDTTKLDYVVLLLKIQSATRVRLYERRKLCNTNVYRTNETRQRIGSTSSVVVSSLASPRRKDKRTSSGQAFYSCTLVQSAVCSLIIICRIYVCNMIISSSRSLLSIHCGIPMWEKGNTPIFIKKRHFLYVSINYISFLQLYHLIHL